MKKIEIKDLPKDDPFTEYWIAPNDDHHRSNRNYEFWLHDDFIYYKDLDNDEERYPQLLHFWASSNCCSISQYSERHDIAPRIKWPKSSLMCECGADSFHIGYGSYECFAICPNCKKEYSIYAG